MALWPFRRKGASRKRSRSGAALSDLETSRAKSPTTSSPQLQRTTSRKQRRLDTADSSRPQRRYSFSPGRQDAIRVERSGKLQKKDRTSTPQHDVRDVQHGSHSPPWERTPTLYHGNGKRRKSSKRRREDHDREAEIKAMSNFMPVRPATESWQAGRPLKKDSKRVKTGYGSHPASEISLPIPASIHSSLSSDTEFSAYKVSMLDALAPRPTLRYARGGRAAQSRASAPPHTAPEKRPLAERAPIPEEDGSARGRIHELADNLDASDLRELMDRDQRRRDRKHQRDSEHAARKLARKAEAHRQRTDDARQTGTPPPENLERGVAGRELVGLGIEPASAVVTSSKQRQTPESLVDAAAGEASATRRPLESFHRTDTVPMDVDEPTSSGPTPLEQKPILQEPTPEPEDLTPSVSAATKLSNILRSKKSRSRSTLNSDKGASLRRESTEGRFQANRKTSEQSTRGGRFSFSSLLRRNGKRDSGGPSSFSNTSREEMQAAAAAASAQTHGHSMPPAQAMALAKLQGDDVPLSTSPEPAPNYLTRKPSTGTPKRTRSRFREDLPEFPRTPPSSDPASPALEPPLPSLPESYAEVQSSASHPRYDSPTSMDQENSSSIPDPHTSMSLASIDSEGSWLSGNMATHRTSALRDSIVRATIRQHQHNTKNYPSDSPDEELTIADDEYLSSLAPNRNSTIMGRRSGETGRPSSDEEDFMPQDEDDGNVNWGSVGARRNDVQSHKRERIPSAQGLLNMASSDGLLDDDAAVVSSGSQSPGSSEEAQVQRARSVELGRGSGHVRNFSAGSAKLLNIPSRSSVDGKRKDRRASLALD